MKRGVGQGGGGGGGRKNKFEIFRNFSWYLIIDYIQSVDY